MQRTASRAAASGSEPASGRRMVVTRRSHGGHTVVTRWLLRAPASSRCRSLRGGPLHPWRASQAASRSGRSDAASEACKRERGPVGSRPRRAPHVCQIPGPHVSDPHVSRQEWLPTGRVDRSIVGRVIKILRIRSARRRAEGAPSAKPNDVSIRALDGESLYLRVERKVPAIHKSTSPRYQVNRDLDVRECDLVARRQLAQCCHLGHPPPRRLVNPAPALVA